MARGEHSAVGLPSVCTAVADWKDSAPELSVVAASGLALGLLRAQQPYGSEVFGEVVCQKEQPYQGEPRRRLEWERGRSRSHGCGALEEVARWRAVLRA